MWQYGGMTVVYTDAVVWSVMRGRDLPDKVYHLSWPGLACSEQEGHPLGGYSPHG